MNNLNYQIDKQLLKHDFNHASLTYDKYADLQGEVALNLLKNIRNTLKYGDRVLDAGCGTGFLAKKTQNLGWNITQCDISHSMCAIAAQYAKTANADMEALPFKGKSFDAIISSLAIQWCNDYENLFSGFFNILKPKGKMILSTFGPKTLEELRFSFMNIIGSAPVNSFAPAEALIQHIEKAGFCNISLKKEYISKEYKDSFDLMRSIKNVGGRYKGGDKRKAASNSDFRRINEFYKKRFGKNAGITGTWEVHYIIASTH